MTNFNSNYQPLPELQLSEHFFRTRLEGLLYFKAPKHNDERGFFSETVILPELEEILGQPFPIKQVNHARSQTKVVRGLHAESWNKLVTVICGSAISVIADLRPNSPTYKQHQTFELGSDQVEEYGSGLYIPQGLANSICVMQGPLSYLYLVDKLYNERSPQDELAVSLFDGELAIDWPIPKEEMILSERDKNAVSLRELLRENDGDGR